MVNMMPCTLHNPKLANHVEYVNAGAVQVPYCANLSAAGQYEIKLF